MLKLKSKVYFSLKRGIDFIVSGVAIILLLPVFIIIPIFIKLDTKGPIIFKQKRIGKNKKEFEIWKYRTMYVDAPKDMPTHLLKNPEQYITKMGKFLRKTSLDELPQLFQIFFGKMAIIGPRPALWNQYDLIAERDKGLSNQILPGLTGWAQVNGRDTISIEEKAKYDNYYAEHASLWLDLKCIFLTVYVVVEKVGYHEGR